MNREYLLFDGASSEEANVRFVSERNGSDLRHIFDAFDVPDIHQCLKKARFHSPIIVGYTSLDAGNLWSIDFYV